MILSLLSMLGGGLMRLLPEVLAFLNKKTDNAHELAMLDRQFQLEQTRASARMDEIREQGDINQVLALLEAQKQALAGQMQKTGIKLVDAANFLVRPVYAYWALALYSFFKIFEMVSAWPSIKGIYTESDFALLSGIASFYFVGRVFDRKK